MLRAALLMIFLGGNVVGAEPGLQEELLSEQAGKHWKELSHLWDGLLKPSAAESHLAQDCRLLSSSPNEKELRLQGDITVSDFQKTAAQIQGRDQVIKALKEWPSTWAEGEIGRSKFKVVGVKFVDEIVTTTQLVSVLVQGRRSAEYNGRWESTWSRNGEELILQSVEMVSGQVATLGQESLFKEATNSVLPMGSDEDRELTGENYYWRQRIPAAFQPDQFGEIGIAVADVNGDGLEDVYLCQIAGLRNRLWIRRQDGTLAESQDSGLGIRDNTSGILFVDFDGDKDRDAVLSTTVGVVFFKNDGSGRFTEVIRLEEIAHGMGLAASDYDQDGDLDLYICQYHSRGGEDAAPARGSFPHPYPVYDATNGGRNILLRNDGDWNFFDATKESGLDLGNSRLSFAALWEDFDNDGDSDLFVVNDFGPNNFFLNLGEGVFKDQSTAPWVREGGFGMGMTAADFDQDGRFDLHVSNMYSGAGNRIARQDWFHADQNAEVRKALLSLARGNTMLRNVDGAEFVDQSEASGTSMGRWSWSSMAIDLNNDSREDLLVANGFVTGKDPDDL
ncbi:VCBS repeat-containing protein [bacterium]|nr:VCBS repeat-containing protein [Akkermansiaceae bacterium]MDB4302603.1 VCBS repeat-containing protein [bacterium]